MPFTKENASLIRQEFGGGRSKGSLSPHTKLKMKTEQLIKRRIFRMAEKLISSQSVAALGTYKVITLSIDEVTGQKKVTTIRDEKHITELLDHGEYGKDYLIVAGAEPDWKAANALLDRAYGKAKETLDLNGEIKFSLKDLADRREGLRAATVIDVPPPK
jgi:hypothetical protein